jgi:hypothetical protein
MTETIINPVFIGACIIGLLWSMWTISFETFRAAFAAVLLKLTQFQDLNAAAGRGNTLSELGSGVLELGARLFLLDVVMIVFAVFSLCMSILFYFRQRLSSKILSQISQGGRGINHNLVIYLGASLIPIAMLTGVFLVSGVTQQFMRYVGFGMLTTSILAAVGIVEFVKIVPRPKRKWMANSIVLVAVSLLLITGSIVYFPSPFIYQDSLHVTKASVDGYETLFEHHSENIEMMSINGIIWRYAVGLEGTRGAPMMQYTAFRGLEPPNHMANQTLHRHYQGDRILVSTQSMRYRETELYEGIYFNERDFEYLNSQPSISRVYSNGDTRAYLIRKK